jgi:hypothetical protein
MRAFHGLRFVFSIPSALGFGRILVARRAESRWLPRSFSSRSRAAGAKMSRKLSGFSGAFRGFQRSLYFGQQIGILTALLNQPGLTLGPVRHCGGVQE